jgi:catecholate siderophore receptor
MFRVSAAALLAASCLAPPAFAADVGTAGEKVELAEADPIVVVGDRGGYEAKETCAATKTCTPLKDVPQAVSVVTAEQIADQSLRS